MEEKASSFTKEVKDTFALLISPRMLYIMPLIMWTAMSLAAYSGSFVPLINATSIDHPDWSDNKKLSMSLFAMIPLGVGEIIGSLAMGKVSDKYGPKTTVIIVLILTLTAFVVLFATIVNYRFNALTFVMTFMWGIQDASVSNFANCIQAFEFESKVTPFSVFKFSQSLFTFAFLVIASKIDDKTKYFIYFSSMGAWATLALAMMLFFKYKPRTK